MPVPPFQLSDEEKSRIASKLNEKGVRAVCPMCSNKNFGIVEGYFNHPIQGSIQSGFVVIGPSVPAIAIICTNCGFISEHALGALGLLPAKEGDKK